MTNEEMLDCRRKRAAQSS